MMQSLFARASVFISMPRAAYVILAASLGALGFALIAQYGFDIQPCILCLWQRVPFVVAAILAVLACVQRPYGKLAQIMLVLCAVAFLINTGIAIFHTGVERHWWEGTRGCSVTPLRGRSVEDWKEQIMRMAVGHCDQISWTFLGLSMTNWNIFLSLSLSGFSLGAVLKFPSPRRMA